MSRLHVFAELLTLPMPMEVSFDSCSYACFMCFAKLNGRPEKRFDWREFQSIVNVFTRTFSDATYDPSDLLQYLLRRRYMICFSNNVDPFGRSNLAYSKAFMDLTQSYRVPLWIQTRTNRDTTFMDWLKPDDTFYVSLCTLDETLAHRIEAGAPPPAHRLACLKEARAKGLRTVLALNPCVPDYLRADQGVMNQLSASRSIDAIIAAALAHDVQGLFIEPMHFRQKQLAYIKPPPEQWPIVQRSVGNDRPFAFLGALFDAARAAQLPVISSCIGVSSWYDPIAWAYVKPFPSHDEVYTYLWNLYQSRQVPLLIPWRTLEWLYHFPTHGFKKHQMLQPFGLRVAHANEVFADWPALVTFADAAQYAYNHVIDAFSIWDHPWFCELLDQDGRNLSDGAGNLVAVFDPTRLGEPLAEHDLSPEALWVEPEGSRKDLPWHVSQAVPLSAGTLAGQASPGGA